MDITEFLKEQAKNYKCPNCRQSLDACGINVLNSVSNIYTVRVTCGHCAVSFVIVITIQTGDSARQPSRRPRKRSQRERAPDAQADPIAADELLEVHEYLEGWSGGLVELLEPRPG